MRVGTLAYILKSPESTVSGTRVFLLKYASHPSVPYRSVSPGDFSGKAS